jgi:hypothetical protein
VRGLFNLFVGADLYFAGTTPAVPSSDVASNFFFADYTAPEFSLPALTFNPLDTASAVTLSGSDLIATSVTTVADKVSRGTRYVINEARVLRFVCTTMATGNDMAVGFALKSQSLNARMWNNTTAIVQDANGNVLSNSVTLDTVSSYAQGDEIFWALKNGQYWIRVNSGDWNNDAAADPDAGTGGNALPSFLLNQPLWPAVNLWNSDGVWTLDPDATGNGLTTFDTWGAITPPPPVGGGRFTGYVIW